MPFEQLLRGLIGGTGANAIHSAVIRLESIDRGLIFEGAAGEARPDTKEPMTIGHRFHTASVTKTFTATAILKLAEDGRLGRDGVDTRLAETGTFPDAVIDRLHRIDGVSYGERITLRHLLTHMSGIRDAMVDDGNQLGGPAPGSLIAGLRRPGADRGMRWVPWEPSRPDDGDSGVLNFYLNRGNLADRALAPPGAAYHYSDTGFVILGLVAEHLAGEPLHDLFRRWIFAPLRLRHSYLAYRNDPPLGPQRQPESDVYVGGEPSFSRGVSFSFDWGGGGIVTTAADLVGFHRGLAGGHVFRHRATFERMTTFVTPPGLPAPRSGVGLGIFRMTLPEDGGLVVGNSGAWGAKMYYDPASRVYLAGTVNRSQARVDWYWPFIKAARSLK